jgi:hypothetical protein
VHRRFGSTQEDAPTHVGVVLEAHSDEGSIPSASISGHDLAASNRAPLFHFLEENQTLQRETRPSRTVPQSPRPAEWPEHVLGDPGAIGRTTQTVVELHTRGLKSVPAPPPTPQAGVTVDIPSVVLEIPGMRKVAAVLHLGGDEHPSRRETISRLERRGYRIVRLQGDPSTGLAAALVKVWLEAQRVSSPIDPGRRCNR